MQPWKLCKGIMFLLKVTCHSADCVFGVDHCQNLGDLPSILCLNACCVDTDGGLKLLCSCAAFTMPPV